MQFTLRDWDFIVECLKRAEEDYLDKANSYGIPEDDEEYENSLYAVYKRNANKAGSLAHEIEHTLMG